VSNRVPFSSGFTKEDYRRLLANGVPIEGRRVGSASLFIEIQSGKPGKSPLFLIGTLMLKLIHSIAKDHPIYCVPGSWFLLSNPEHYIADAAEVLAREVLSIVPDGPYLLGGYCFNGWISYEIARKLKAANKNIDLLFFIDDRAPHGRLRSIVRPLKQILTHACRPFALGTKTADTSGGYFIRESDSQLLETPSSIIAVRTAAANCYKRGCLSYEGDIDVFLCDNGSWIKNLLDRLDWRGLIRGKSRIRFIQGSHDWADPMQLEKLGQIFASRLVNAQKMAEHRKPGH
jgi:hypothetical protein